MSGRVALVVARSGRLRDGLRALVSAVPGLAAVDAVDDAQAALDAIAASRPALVVLDGTLPCADMASILGFLRTDHPHSTSLVLADDLDQGQAARALGADRVALTGVSAARLLRLIESLVCAVPET